MNTINLPVVLFPVFLLCASAFLGGCAATGPDMSAKTTGSIKEMDSEIRQIIFRIDATGASLGALLNAEESGLEKTFDTYSGDLARLDGEGKLVLERLEEIRSQGKKYFSDWKKQNSAHEAPQDRELSEKRRNKMAAIYAQLPVASAEILKAYQIYLTDLKGIQLYLSRDLTPAGVEAIKPLSRKTVQDLDNLKASLGPVISALEEIKSELFWMRPV